MISGGGQAATGRTRPESRPEQLNGLERVRGAVKGLLNFRLFLPEGRRMGVKKEREERALGRSVNGTRGRMGVEQA